MLLNVIFSFPLDLKMESPVVVLKALTFISSIEASFCASLSLRRPDIKWNTKYVSSLLKDTTLKQKAMFLFSLRATLKDA